MAFVFVLSALLLVPFEVAAHALVRFVVARAVGVGGVRFFSSRVETKGSVDAPYAARALVASAGVLASYGIAVVLCTFAFWQAGDARVDEVSMRIDVTPDGPADHAGLARGDRIVAVEGETVRDWASLRAAVAAHPGMPIDVAYDRASARVHVAVTPDAGGKIRVTPYTEKTPTAFGAAVAHGALQPFLLFYSLAREWTDLSKPRAQPSGPIAIVRGMEQSFSPLFFAGFAASYLIPLNLLFAIVAFPRRPRKALAAATATDHSR